VLYSEILLYSLHLLLNRISFMLLHATGTGPALRDLITWPTGHGHCATVVAAPIVQPPGVCAQRNAVEESNKRSAQTRAIIRAT
jgi:hypothetical protein